MGASVVGRRRSDAARSRVRASSVSARGSNSTIEGALSCAARLGVACARARRRAGPRSSGMRQVHCADVFEATGELGTAAGPRPILPSRDDPSWPSAVRAADCVPILLADPAKRSGCGCSCRLEGHGCGRGYGGRRLVTSAIRHERRRCRSPPSVRASARAATRWARTWRRNFPPIRKRRRGSRQPRNRISICGAPLAISSRARVCRLTRFTCARCAHSITLLVFHSYRRDGKGAGRLVAAIRSAAGRTP